jgi:uncharacterized Zn-binding protein involved in type VI secretion
MPAAARKDDIGSDHACHFPQTPAIEGSPDVTINGKPAVRVGDAFEAHACPEGHAPKHERRLKDGSPSVFINGQPAGRVGDAIDCGGAVETGSDDVHFDGG